MANLFAKKDLPTLMKEAVEVEGEQSLRRALGPLNLLTLGIGAIIGAGIFVITGQAAAQFAGPAIVISYWRVWPAPLRDSVTPNLLR